MLMTRLGAKAFMKPIYEWILKRHFEGITMPCLIIVDNDWDLFESLSTAFLDIAK